MKRLPIIYLVIAFFTFFAFSCPLTSVETKEKTTQKEDKNWSLWLKGGITLNAGNTETLMVNGGLKFHLESKDEKGSYKGLGQTLIYTPNDEATWLAMVVVDEMNSSIFERIKQYSLVERPIESSSAWSAGNHFGIPAFTVETCKQLPLEERVEYQVRIVNIILREKGIF